MQRRNGIVCARELCMSGRPHTCAPEQSFSNLNVPASCGDLAKCSFWFRGSDQASDSAFLTGSQEMLILLVQGLHSE